MGSKYGIFKARCIKGLCTKLTRLARPLCIIFVVAALAACSAKNGLVVVEFDGAEELYGKGMELFQEERLDDAEAYFKRLMEDYPLSAYSLEAQLMLADLYFSRSNYSESGSYYATFAILHPSHHKAPYALFQKGMSNFKEVLSVDRDQTAGKKALIAFEDLISRYPESPYSTKAGELIRFIEQRFAMRELYVGKYYYRHGKYRGALWRFEKLIRDYPEAECVDQALYYIAEVHKIFGDETLAAEAYSRLIDDFPESPLASEAVERLGEG